MSIIIPGILNTGQITTVSIDDNAVTQAKLAHDIDVSHLINDAGYKSDLTSFTTDNLTEGSTNLYWTEARFDTSFGNKDTGDLTEGSNLYYTDARVQTWFTGTGIGLLSTDYISEGSSNLYFTDARAVSAIEADTSLELNSPVTIDSSAGASKVVIGDDTLAGIYDIHGLKITADDTKWGSITIKEYVGGANKPINSFTNPTFGTEVIGGTPTSESNVVSGKRLFVLQSVAANETDGTLPTTSNFRIKAETTEDQTTSARGTKLQIDTTRNGDSSTSSSMEMQGNEITINTGGDGKLKSGGDLILDDDVQVTGTLEVDGTATFNGNMTLGDANTDVITSTGKLVTSNGLTLTNLNTSTANYLAGLGIIDTGSVAYISDGDAGSPCCAFYDGSNWKRMHSPSTNISAT